MTKFSPTFWNILQTFKEPQLKPIVNNIWKNSSVTYANPVWQHLNICNKHDLFKTELEFIRVDSQLGICNVSVRFNPSVQWIVATATY